ncbi:uncharacterized protein LOC126597179 isoform X2 [Malus sylvestris]|uniref:uncharacterized protein LOC126597179 isoform X2 n=1 Tax=Malus sylvestris TaxID=3752 RepID=UPI0021AC8B4F|nr:uncharacterized protein LOC126597179 isoform X2 [Malus sylvestris]
MPLAPKPENFIPGDLSCSPSDLSRSPGHVLRLGVLPLGISCITYEKTTHDALLQVYLFFVPLHRLDLYFDGDILEKCGGISQHKGLESYILGTKHIRGHQ